MISVIGGINLDILGDPFGPVVMRDSNVGHVSFRAGGVGRNIAAAVCEIGGKARLMTVLGNDRNGDGLLEECEELGMDMSLCGRADAPTNIYLAMHDENGDMLCALNDMRTMEMLTPEMIEKHAEELNKSELCILDANLSDETLQAAVRLLTVPLMMDPVSCIKAHRCLPVMRHLFAIKPNAMEAEEMTGCTDYREAAEKLLEMGVKQVYISLGREGVYFASAEDKGRLLPKKITNLLQTGAGDSMCAGIACAITKGMDIRSCAMSGMDAAYARLTGGIYRI